MGAEEMRWLLIATLLAGCAYNSQTVNAYGSLVYCHGTVDKPVDVSTDLKGNKVTPLP